MDWKDDPDLESPRFGRWYDIDGHPITFGRWVKLQKVAELEGYDYRSVAWDEFDGYYVSTILLGTNMNLARPAKPLIFETLPFIDEPEERAVPVHGGGVHHYTVNPSLDQFMRRYETKAQALRGHVEVCEELRSMIRETLQVTER